jgi:uncharacterized membrane protein YeaQ/YmgE (transglycosylase-associated protein family)
MSVQKFVLVFEFSNFRDLPSISWSVIDRSKETDMTWLEVLVLLVVAGICGGIARSLTGYSHGGCLASIALGFIGALLGAWIARQMNLTEPVEITIGTKPFPVVWSIIGATLFTAVLGLLTRRSGPPPE